MVLCIRLYKSKKFITFINHWIATSTFNQHKVWSHVFKSALDKFIVKNLSTFCISSFLTELLPQKENQNSDSLPFLFLDAQYVIGFLEIIIRQDVASRESGKFVWVRRLHFFRFFFFWYLKSDIVSNFTPIYTCQVIL